MFRKLFNKFGLFREKAPEAPRDDSVVDILHGFEVADPFRPLEKSDDPAVLEWIEEHNERTDKYINKAQASKTIPSIIEDSFNYPRQSPVRKYGNTKVWTRNEGLDPQDIYYYQREGEDEVKVLFDPMKENEEGRVFVQSVKMSPSGRYAAIQTAWDGNDTSSIRIFDFDTESYLDEEVDQCRYSNVVWAPDEKSFLYDRYIKNETTTGAAPFQHVLGTDVAQDTEALSHDGTDGVMLRAERILGNDEYFAYTKSVGTSRHKGLILSRYDDVTNGIEIIEPLKASAEPVAFENGKLLIITDLNAPNGRLVSVDPQNPEPENWVDVISESERVLEDAFVAQGKLYTTIREGMSQTIEIYKTDGTLIKELDLPKPCSVGLYTPLGQDTKAPMAIQTYLSAGDQYEYDFVNDTYELVRESECPHNLKDCEVTQGFSTSDDGTKIPYVMIHPKDMKKNGKNKTIIYGYGGFNSPVSPGYRTTVMAWVRQGGVYVFGGIRGGSEYGYNWWKGGALENKINCSSDFASIARQLHDDNVTKPNNTVIYGGSNGGTLVATCANRFPNLFGGVHCAVPVADMYRYHLDHTPYSIGKYWKSDFGDPDNPTEFEWIRHWSPLHNVQEGVKYPDMYITTTYTEQRVEPLHGLKLAATLVDQTHPDSNILLRVKMNTGHGAGKSVQMMAQEIGEEFGFYERAVGKLPKPKALEATLKKQRNARDARVAKKSDQKPKL